MTERRVEIEKEYKVKPLECWEKFKEIRRQQVKRLWNAKEDGRLLILGLVQQASALPMGLGDISIFTLGPNYGRILDNGDLARDCARAAESHGFSSDVCATMRMQLGSIYLGFHNQNLRTGKKVMADFALETYYCPSQSKMLREMSDHYGLPCFVVEIPPFAHETAHDYLVAQMHDCIKWMEKTTGRTYDDEKLIEATYNEWRSRVYYARTCKLVQNIPAPLDFRQLASINVMQQVGKNASPEVAQALKLLYEEVKERVSQGVPALGIEKVRLLHEGYIPQYACGAWSTGYLVRSGIDYGAVVIGARDLFTVFGAWKTEGGKWEPPQTLDERGVILKSREDALRSLAELILTYAPHQQSWNIVRRTDDQVAVTKNWHADAVIINLDRGCHGTTPALMECSLALEKLGIPTMIYEASGNDPREFNQPKFLESLHIFLERLGLHPL